MHFKQNNDCHTLPQLIGLLKLSKIQLNLLSLALSHGQKAARTRFSAGVSQSSSDEAKGSLPFYKLLAYDSRLPSAHTAILTFPRQSLVLVNCPQSESFQSQINSSCPNIHQRRQPLSLPYMSLKFSRLCISIIKNILLSYKNRGVGRDKH